MTRGRDVRRATPWLLGTLSMLAACGGVRAGTGMATAPASSCAPVEGSLSPGVSFAAMSGSYRLIMRSSEGGSDVAEGELSLRSRPDGARSMGGASTPLDGTARIELADVGAQAVTGLTSKDPSAPGVLVIEDDRGVILRLGSEANRTGEATFDGAYTVLSVSKVDNDGFAGAWRSGLRARTSSGYFCAWRTAPTP